MIKLGFHMNLNRLTATAYEPIDYQGNVRAVISQNGVLEEVNGYYSYGGITGAPATGVQKQ